MGRKIPICDTCGYPVKRGRVPILWPSVKLGRRAYCSVACWEAASGTELPEPMRSQLLEVENAA